MTIKLGSVYNVTVKSGNTPSAFSWPGKVPDSGNKYMKNKVIKITKKLNPKDSLDYDYVGDIYDKIDGAVELKNIKIVSKQLLLKSSTFKVAGKRKKSKKRTKKKKSKKRTKRKSKRSSRKTGRSYIKKTRKRMKGGGTDSEYNENGLTEIEQAAFDSFAKRVRLWAFDQVVSRSLIRDEIFTGIIMKMYELIQISVKRRREEKMIGGSRPEVEYNENGLTESEQAAFDTFAERVRSDEFDGVVFRFLIRNKMYTAIIMEMYNLIQLSVERTEKLKRGMKMMGGSRLMHEWENSDEDNGIYEFSNLRRHVTAPPRSIPTADEIFFAFSLTRRVGTDTRQLGNFQVSSYFFEEMCEELSKFVDDLECDLTKDLSHINYFLDTVLNPITLTRDKDPRTPEPLKVETAERARARKGRSIFLTKLHETGTEEYKKNNRAEVAMRVKNKKEEQDRKFREMQERLARKDAEEKAKKEAQRGPGMLGRLLSRGNRVVDAP